MMRLQILRTALLGLATHAAEHGEAPPQAVWRDIDPMADETLRSMSDLLRITTSFSYIAVTATNVPLADGPIAEYAGEVYIRVRRPDRLAATTRGDLNNEDVWYNGTQLTVLDLDRNEYAVEDVPETLDAMLDHMVTTYGVSLPLADLAYGNIYDTVMADVLEGRYLGRHEVDGRPCHHLAYRQNLIDWQIWIDAVELPLPRRIVIVYLGQDRQPRFKAQLSDWNLAAELPDETFEFTTDTDPELISMDVFIGQNEGEQP
jgi:hypothetical protein